MAEPWFRKSSSLDKIIISHKIDQFRGFYVLEKWEVYEKLLWILTVLFSVLTFDFKYSFKLDLFYITFQILEKRNKN